MGGRAPRLERVQDREDRVSRRRLQRTRLRRARRIAAGFVVAALGAGSIGAYVGFASHRTSEELTEAQMADRQRDTDISREINRTLLELWKMEDFESLRDQGRTR